MSDTADPAVAAARAPATVGNAAVGFDILGFAVDAAFDRVTVRRLEDPTVRIASIEGEGAAELPSNADENTATVGLVQLIDELDLDHGFEVELDKGIPLKAGMGGSGASAVASIVAADALIEPTLSTEMMMSYALLGESVASGALHGDNVAPALFGGLVLMRSIDPPDVVDLDVPDSIHCALVHPQASLETSQARRAVPDEFPLERYVDQSMRLAGFVAGCCRGDIGLIRESMEDVLIEPHRAPLVPGFERVKRAALDAGALGCSLSGAGPSVFAWCHPAESADGVCEAMVEAFEAEGIEAQGWTSPIATEGASLVES